MGNWFKETFSSFYSSLKEYLGFGRGYSSITYENSWGLGRDIEGSMHESSILPAGREAPLLLTRIIENTSEQPLKESEPVMGKPLEREVLEFQTPFRPREGRYSLNEALSCYYRDYAREQYEVSQARLNPEKRLEEELVHLYQTSDWSVRKITMYLNAKYQQRLSPSSVSRRARKKLRVQSRKEAREYAQAA